MPRPLALSAIGLLLVLPALLAAGCGDPAPTPSGGSGASGGTPPSASPYASTPYAAGSAAAAPLAPDLRREAEAALARARDLLVGAQAPDGGWGDPELALEPNVGYTALACAALVAATPGPAVASDPNVKKALAWLAARQKDDGSIWDNPQYVNYMTSAAVGAFALARQSEYRQVELAARDFLAASQIAGDTADLSYGGFPYKQGQGQVADLSNLQFAVQALADAGLPADHPAWERIRVFLSRVQNSSESNETRIEATIDGAPAVVVSGDDGGAGYGPGTSKAGFVKRADGTFETRSYGSMTYALLKCLLLAGVDVTDRRVKAAIEWTQSHFVLDRNPGFESASEPEVAGQQGWYYYVFTLARALAEVERRTKAAFEVRAPDGTPRAWRAELVRAILDRQREDGWWVNDVSERWEEGAPVLATSYAVVALAEALGRFR